MPNERPSTEKIIAAFQSLEKGQAIDVRFTDGDHFALKSIDPVDVTTYTQDNLYVAEIHLVHASSFKFRPGSCLDFSINDIKSIHHRYH